MIPKIRFIFDRHKRAINSGKGTVEIRITLGKSQKFISTGISCRHVEWDDLHECIINTTDAMTLNEIIAKMRLKALKIINGMIERDSFDLNEVALLLKMKEDVKITFIGYIRKRMVERPVKDTTKNNYNTFLSRFTEWGKMAFFSEITERNIRAWDEYLHSVRWKENDRYGKETECKYSQATISAMHKHLKLFINDAKVDGYVKENPYCTKRIKIDKGETRIDMFLTPQEISKVETANLPTESLSEARDLFLIQVYTGLSYIDLMEYDFTQIKEADDYSVFNGKRHKTGISFTFVATPKAKSILQRHDFVLPHVPNQKYNIKLKLIADAAGIDKNITSHMGRRSCGYTLLNAGVPISVVSRVLGHASIKVTEQSYARILDDTIAEEIKKHIK